MCYYSGQKATRAEFIQLKQLEKTVKNYDFLDKEVHKQIQLTANYDY